MSKPLPPDPDSQGPIPVDNWMAAHHAPAGHADQAYGGGPQLQAPPQAAFDGQEYLDSTERVLPLTDPRVLCTRCRHGWIMAEPAPTKNLKPDGTEFKRYKGTCCYGGGRMSLQEMRPTECNRFELDPRAPVSVEASPQEAAAPSGEEKPDGR